jgi:hypothetical protein
VEQCYRCPVLIIEPQIKAVAKAPRNRTDVTFFLEMDDGIFCGTLNTSQSTNTILKLVKSGELLVIEASLDQQAVLSQSGEEFRMLIGVLNRI